MTLCNGVYIYEEKSLDHYKAMSAVMSLLLYKCMHIFCVSLIMHQWSSQEDICIQNMLINSTQDGTYDMSFFGSEEKCTRLPDLSYICLFLYSSTNITYDVWLPIYLGMLTDRIILYLYLFPYYFVEFGADQIMTGCVFEGG